MVLKFKRIGFFRKAKERREEPKSEVVCLRYVQHQEFDICYLSTSREIRLSQFREPVQTEIEANDTNFQILNQSETTTSTEKNSYDQSNFHMPEVPEPEVQKKVVPRPRSFRQSDNTEGIVDQLGNTEGILDQLGRREEEHREVSKPLESERDESFVQSEPVVAEESEVVKPIAKPRSILKNAQVAPNLEEEADKKSTLIFMTENHVDTKEEPPLKSQIVPEVEDEVEDALQMKKSVMFDESNLSNKGQVIEKTSSVTDSDDDYDSDEYDKDFSNNAASIFFDGGDPDPVERMSRINLNRDSDEESVQSQTSA